jgi:hypothetical protein
MKHFRGLIKMNLKTNKTVSLSLQKDFPIDKETHKILCDINYANYTNNELKIAVANLFNNKVSLVESSVRKVGNDLLTMVVTANRISKPFKLSDTTRQITANIITDLVDNTVWEIVSVDGKKRMILKSDLDFNSLFRESDRIRTEATLYNAPEINVDNYVSFYKDKKVTSGFVFSINKNNVTITDRECNRHEVNSNAVLDVADLSETEMQQLLASFDKSDATKVLDYYKILYKNTAFFNKLDTLVGVRVKDGINGKFESTMVLSGFEGDDISNIKDELKDYLIDLAIEDLEDEMSTRTLGEDEEDVIEDLDGNLDGELVDEDELEYDEDIDDDEAKDEPRVSISEEEVLEDEEIESEVKPSIKQNNNSIDITLESDYNDLDVNDMTNDELIAVLSEVIKESEGK